MTFSSTSTSVERKPYASSGPRAATNGAEKRHQGVELESSAAPNSMFWIQAPLLEGEARELLMSVADRAWPYARRIAWSYLHDEAMAAGILERATEQIAPYLLRAARLPSHGKLLLRLRSQLRRIAQQNARRRRLEVCLGGVSELELIGCSSRSETEDRLFLEEILALLSPNALAIAQSIRMGWTWREIARDFGADHTTVRRAFRREVDGALAKLRLTR